MSNRILILNFLFIALFGVDSIYAGIDECEVLTQTPEAKEVPGNDTPYKKGMLWKVKKENKTNYVFGTIHSQDYTVSNIPPPVRLALLKTRLLLMETVPDESANQIFFSHMYFKDDTRLDNYLDPVMFQRLSSIIVEYGIPDDRVAEITPWAAFSLIGRPKPVRAASQEMNLLNVARQSVAQIKSLESMEEIIASLNKLSIEDQIAILKDAICNHSQIIRDAKILVDLYIDRDLEGIVKFNRQPHHDEALFERFMQAILYDRNEKLLETIEAAFALGNTFVAIGTSHLADEAGLLSQLAERGYELTMIY